MRNLLDSLSNTDGTAMVIALLSANPTIISTEIANESAELSVLVVLEVV
jgi:hypothetical protein